MRLKFLGFAVALLPVASNAQGFDDADPVKAARAVIVRAYAAPCGDVVAAKRTPGGNLMAECTNGMRYGALRRGSGVELMQFNSATGQWASYAR